MKKKLILMLSIMVIAVCMFALTVSATNAVYVSDGITTAQIVDLSEGRLDYNFKFYADSSTYDLILLDNVEEFQSFVGTKTVIELREYFDALYNETGEVVYQNFMSIPTEAYEFFINYAVFSEEDLTQQYNNGISEGIEIGKTQGVTEYKGSNEYLNAINTAKADGKLEGIEYFKTSTEYETTLNNKYVLGQKEGVANYLKSDDYTNALDAEYDAGYNQGVSDTESTSSSSGTGALFSVLAIVLVVLAGFYIYKSVSRKRRR